MDGIELLRELSSLGLTARILVISGSDPKVMESAMFLGTARGMRMVGCLQKPLRIDDLRKILDQFNPHLSEPTGEDLQEAIDFAVQGKVRATVHTACLEAINGVFDEMKAGDIQGRMVLKIAEP